MRHQFNVQMWDNNTGPEIQEIIITSSVKFIRIVILSSVILIRNEAFCDRFAIKKTLYAENSALK